MYGGEEWKGLDKHKCTRLGTFTKYMHNMFIILCQLCIRYPVLPFWTNIKCISVNQWTLLGNSSHPPEIKWIILPITGLLTSVNNTNWELYKLKDDHSKSNKNPAKSKYSNCSRNTVCDYAVVTLNKSNDRNM